MLDIYTIGEEVLQQKAEKITEFDNALSILVDAMFETMIEADGIGLAAPQIGISKRLFVVNTRKIGEQLVCINPEILSSSEEQGVYEEGCLSVPGVYHDIIRPLEITLRAQDLSGKPYIVELTGLLARVVQHEYDHLQGVLFVDRLKEEEKQKVLSAYNKRNKRKK